MPGLSAKESPETFLGIQSEIKRLEDYYSGQNWKDDFALDEEGMLPSDLMRHRPSGRGECFLVGKPREVGCRVVGGMRQVSRYDTPD